MREDMETYLANIESCTSGLRTGFKMRECLKVALILRWLPDSFNPLITTSEALQDEEELTLDFV